MSERPIEDTYLRTVYAIERDGRMVEFSFDGRSIPGSRRVAVDAGVAWALVTAWNPISEWLTDEENLLRQAKMEAMIVGERLASRPSLARSAAGEWREPGCVLVGVSREDALDYGREFEQRAIVWCERGKVGLIDCGTERWIVRAAWGLEDVRT